MKNGIYIYGVIKTSSPQEFGNIGIGNETPEVLTIQHKDIAAVISRSPLITYGSLARDKTIKDLVTHQFVIEKVMQTSTIVPVKFGTMVQTEDEVIKFLEKGHSLLRNELHKTEGKIELDVVASWELSKILPAICRDNSLIQKKQQEIALKGDKASIEDKVTLGQLIEQALKARKTSYNELFLQTLKEGTVDVCLHELAGDEMILNAAFLLAKNDEEAFNKLVTILDQHLENTVNFRVVGPLPPYSFATILLERIDPLKLEEAKKTIGLNGELTDKTLRDAYYRLAQQSHPDKNNAQDSPDFHLVASSYRTLKNFVENGLMRVELYQWEKSFQ